MSSDAYVHESSVVDANVELGERTKVWHFCHLSEGSSIGDDCTLGQNVFVGENVPIGHNCKIQNNVSIYEGVELEDDVFCGPSMVFTNVDTPRSAYPRDRASYDRTLVQTGCTIGANATILCGVTLGAHAFIGAGAVVTHDVPDFALVFGNPARLRGWMCYCGAKLTFHERATSCERCGQRFEMVSETAIQPFHGDGA